MVRNNIAKTRSSAHKKNESNLAEYPKGAEGKGAENNSSSGCCHQNTFRSQEQRKKLISRLNRIEGQIKGIRNMIEEDRYCVDILTQSAAANAAINAFNRELISSHIRSCVLRDIKEGKEDTIDELITALQKLMK